MIKRYLLTGLLLWVPLGITLWVLHFLVTTLDGVVNILPIKWRSESLFGMHIYGFGILITFIVLMTTGLIARNFFGAQLVKFWENLLGKVPVVGGVYKSVKQISDTVLSDSGQAFSKAVLVEFPHAGSHTVGFLTGHVSGELAGILGSESVSVYIPTTPNPTSGYMVLVARHKIKELDLTVDQALKYIISMGAVSAEISHSDKRNQ
ncbi:MAG: hypothetical protein RLZZ502_1936 [Pseudomonadota bacterium]|jgi:uncharacterized membrane protein